MQVLRPSSFVLRQQAIASATTFGMRTIATSPSGQLLLNGRSIYLRGALDQDYYPDLVYTPFSDSQLDAQFAQAQHMGLNCLRTHIKITDPRYYAAADRAGLLIWTELPNWQNLTAAAKKRARATLAGMVERDWNHPSIVIWTIINENWGTDLGVNADHRAWLAETYDYMKALDPHRLVVGNSACNGNFQVVTDLLDFHNYYAIPDHYRNWRDWVADFAGRPGLGLRPQLRRYRRMEEAGRRFLAERAAHAHARGAQHRQRAADRLGVRQLGPARHGQAARRLRRKRPLVVRDRLGARQRRGLPASASISASSSTISTRSFQRWPT